MVVVRVLRVFMRVISKSERVLRLWVRVSGTLHLFLYRLTGGWICERIGLRGGRVLLLTTTGRKTGKPRTIPLLSITDADDLVIIASNGGQERHPAWWLNLKANPEAKVQIGRKTIRVRSELADSVKRSQLWSRFTAVNPGYIDYQKRTLREIPIVILHSLESLEGKS